MRFARRFTVAASVVFLIHAHAAAAVSNPINVSGIVNGPPPVHAPTIQSPVPQASVMQKLATVSGQCQAGLTVEISRNGGFAGSALCGNGSYSLAIGLSAGRNDLIARQYDSTNQYSPDSLVVSVFYTPAVPTPLFPGTAVPVQPVARFELAIGFGHNLQTIFTGNPLRLPLYFLGGSAPYVGSIDWGDGHTDELHRAHDGQFFAEHVFKAPGRHVVKVHVTDQFGNQSFLQFVVVVNGSLKPIAGQQPAAVFAIQSLPAAFIAIGVAGGAGFGLGLLAATLVRRLFKPW